MTLVMTMWKGLMEIIQNPNPTKNHIGCSQASLYNLRVEVFPPQRKETGLPSVLHNIIQTHSSVLWD